MDPRVRHLYKLLTYMARDYPIESGGPAKFMGLCRKRFRQTKISNEEQLQMALAKGDYIIKGMYKEKRRKERGKRERGEEIKKELKEGERFILTTELEALYFLRRYRHLKRSYPDP